jgi:hypothetical protein
MNTLVVFAIVVAVTGWGFLVPTRAADENPTFGDRFLLGIVLITAFALLANLFVPLQPFGPPATFVVGIASFVLGWRRVWKSLGERPLAAATVLAALIVLVGFGTGLATIHGDTGLYHLQSIDWMEQSRRVVGLANLHNRLGYNSIWLPFAAMLDFPGIGRRGIFLLNAALFVVVFAAFIQPSLLSWRSERRWPVSQLFAACVLTFFSANVVELVFGYMAFGPSYDAPAWLLILYAFWRFLAMGEESARSGREEQALDRTMVALSSALAVMVKLSSLPVLLLGLFVLVHTDRGWKRRIAPLAAGPAWLWVVTFGLWVASGLVTSGCLLFPVPSTCIQVLPWAVRTDMARFNADIITFWARSPGTDFYRSGHGWAWLKTWPETMLMQRAFVPGLFKTLVALSVVALIFRLVDLLWPSLRVPVAPASSNVRWAFLFAVFGAAFWLVEGPDPRFGVGFLIAVPSLALAWFAAGPPSTVGVARFLAGGASIVTVTAIGLVWALLTHWGKVTSEPALPIPQTPMAHHVLPSGMEVSTPVASVFCWDAPLPCTPELDTRLSRGTAGPWQVLYFPKP